METVKTMKDIRGIDIDIGDTVAVSNKYSSSIEIAVVEDKNLSLNEIFLEDGEPVNLDKNDVLVLPDHYKEW